MKNILKIILALFIVNCAFLIGQTSGYDVNVAIGSTTILTWKVAGDYSGYDSLYFAVKACTTSSDCGRLVGPSKNCSVSYANPYTTVRCTLYAANTAGFNSAKYFYSIYAYGSDTVAVRSGLFNLQLNGQTSVDGIATNEPIYLIALDPPDHDTTFIVGYISDSTWNELTVDQVRSILNLDTNAVDANFDSLYGYWVNKHERQNITAQKNFTGTIPIKLNADSSVRLGGTYAGSSVGIVKENVATNYISSVVGVDFDTTSAFTADSLGIQTSATYNEDADTSGGTPYDWKTVRYDGDIVTLVIEAGDINYFVPQQVYALKRYVRFTCLDASGGWVNEAAPRKLIALIRSGF